MSFEFVSIKPNDWCGRYGAIPGKSSVLHIGYSARHGKAWSYALMSEYDDRGCCWALESSSANALVKAVQQGKKFFGYETMGAFLVNEYGQVIVPASDGQGQRALVGTICGSLQFENPFINDAVFDLSDDKGLMCGDPWPKPYVGSKYNWSFRDGIHYREGAKEGKRIILCPHQDASLVKVLRKVRAEGYIRFIVNPHGLVLTKRKTGSRWQPVYVGRIDYSKWFPKEGS